MILDSKIIVVHYYGYYDRLIISRLITLQATNLSTPTDHVED